MRGLARVVPLLVVLIAVATADAKAPRWTWASLHRPLHLPRIAAGATCPVTPMHRVAVGRNDFVTAPGRGPAYPLLFANTTVPYVWPLTSDHQGYGTPWSGNKVMWIVAARYKGPVLVRGRQLDGPHTVRFDHPPKSERRLIGSTGGTSGARRYPSSTRIEGTAPGCYAYQVDGIGFSRVIVFRAEPYGPPRREPPPPGRAPDVSLSRLALGARGDAKRPRRTWASLHRPLRIPQIPPGAACPISAIRSVTLSRSTQPRELRGPGPAYPNLINGRLEFTWPPTERQVDFYGTGWSGNKALWWVKRAYKGPVLIRGRQLDGPHVLRFDLGTPPASELRIPPYTTPYYRTHARDRPSYTRVEAPGCYAYQVDGLGFSYTVVFEARIVPEP